MQLSTTVYMHKRTQSKNTMATHILNSKHVITICIHKTTLKYDHAMCLASLTVNSLTVAI